MTIFPMNVAKTGGYETPVLGSPISVGRRPAGTSQASGLGQNPGTRMVPKVIAGIARCLFSYQWEFQEPKLEVPTIYKAYVRPM
jgi:hypothetical protein